MSEQLLFTFATEEAVKPKPFRLQLLKWIGNKQRFAHEIVSYFPANYGTYHEPFLGSGAVLATLAPRRAYGSDVFEPLIGIWQTLHNSPETLKLWYEERWERIQTLGKEDAYEDAKANYNANPNPADLVFLCRACYGGVVRFRKQDGFMSTPCGPHAPVSPDSFNRRVDQWHARTIGARFDLLDFEQAMERAQPGDIVYCDPPYTFSQKILYGAQAFSLERLFGAIAACKRRGVFVAMSIDGSKKSGNHLCDISIPKGLFEEEALVNCGRSMLRRFQMNGQTLEEEVVADRLLLTY